MFSLRHAIILLIVTLIHAEDTDAPVSAPSGSELPSSIPSGFPSASVPSSVPSAEPSPKVKTPTNPTSSAPIASLSGAAILALGVGSLF